MIVLMYNLASTADQYLSPSLEYITLKFKLSESLAGVTLLAFGNGAPDVFSALSASEQGATVKKGAAADDGPQELGNALLPTSALMGSALFISTIVVQMSLRAQTVSEPHLQVKMTPYFFLRDIAFYLMVMIYLLVIMLFVGRVDFIVGIGFLLAYAVYVTVVVT